MKNSTVFSVLCLTVLLALITLSLGQQPKYCKASFPRTGGGVCGTYGNQDCLTRALGQYGPSKMPKNATCVDIGKTKTSKCNCFITC
ncbi:hypothetical protein OROHE_026697 [Orobanche hederae]